VHAHESLRAAVAYAGRRPMPRDGLPPEEHELPIVPGERLLVGDAVAGRRWCYSTRGDAGWVHDEDLIRVEDAPRFLIRPIAPADDAAVAAIIRTVMPEFGADGPGFAIHDPEVAAMHAAYAREGAAYFVIEREGRVLGGGGVAPLDGVAGTCELRKMYFLPALRGLGAGTALIGRCLLAARLLGYRRCYLETLTGMDAAQALYERAGFQRIEAALGATGHHGCDRFFLRAL
jgi:putative acetyltransferase